MKTFDDIKYDALEYIGLYEAPAGDLDSILTAAAAKYGEDVFLDPGSLHKGMTEAGASELECCRVYLMTQVSGFQKLLSQDLRTAQLDLDRYVQNAAEETGFNRDTILRLTGSIVSAVGGSMASGPRPGKGTAFIPHTSALLSSSLYEGQLRDFQANLDQVCKGNNQIKLDFTSIESLANLGIPRAKYCLGYCMLNAVQLAANEEQGLELLQEAADMGDSRAAAALGDYCYRQGGSGSWTQAYQYYTGFGAAALDETRKSAVASILNQKRFNRKLLGLCALLLAACALTVIFPPAPMLYASRPVWGWLTVTAQLVLLVLGCMHHRVRPYDFLYWLPAAMSGMWFIYIAIRLLF